MTDRGVRVAAAWSFATYKDDDRLELYGEKGEISFAVLDRPIVSRLHCGEVANVPSTACRPTLSKPWTNCWAETCQVLPKALRPTFDGGFDRSLNRNQGGTHVCIAS